MSRNLKRLLFWLPRGLCVLFAAFISLFALDVFGEGYSPGETLVALFMHLLPTFVILLALAIAWRRDLVGALLFAALGVAFVIFFDNRPNWLTYLIVAGPLFLISALFLLDWGVDTRAHQAG